MSTSSAESTGSPRPSPGRPPAAHWRVSTRCGATGDCVAVDITPDHVKVRTTAADTMLVVSREAWSRFVHAAKHGDLDRHHP